MGIAAFRCPSCGAQIGDNETRCQYCKSQLATVACPSCFGMVSLHAQYCSHCGTKISVVEQGESSNIQCPQCRIKLVITSLGGLEMHQCHQCGGLWLAKERFESLTQARERRSLDLPNASGENKLLVNPAEPIRYRPCPVCAKFMNRLNYAKISGIILDSCREHGLWFDRDELQQSLKFVESGGLERSRERERRKFEDEAGARMPSNSGPMPPDEPRKVQMDLEDMIEMGGLAGKILKGAAQTLWESLKR